jgi:hypothetical protein
VKRTCSVCSTEFEAKNMRARYCGGTCSKRAQRMGAARSTTAASLLEALPADSPEGDGCVATTVAALTKAGRLNTPRGQAAVKLARLIDNATAVMGFAALTKEHDRLLDVALAGAVVAADPVDELRARRDRKVDA